MNLKNHLFSAAALLLLLGSSAQANIVVDGTFDTGITGTWDTQSRWGGSNLQNGSGVAASNAFIYDDGWLTFNFGGNDVWNVSGGEAVRAPNIQRFNAAGFGQMVSNPANGQFDNGDGTLFSFDYELDGVNATNISLAGSVFGINALSGTGTNWDLAGGDAIENFGLAGSNATTIGVASITGPNYTWTLLDTFATTAEVTGTYTSPAITLADDYELFAFVFQAADKQSAATNTFVDNVSFTAVIPEPSSVVMTLLGFLTLWLSRRRKD